MSYRKLSQQNKKQRIMRCFFYGYLGLFSWISHLHIVSRMSYQAISRREYF